MSTRRIVGLSQPLLRVLALSTACRPAQAPEPPATAPNADAARPAAPDAERAPEPSPPPPDDPRPRLVHAETCAEEAVRIDEAGVCLQLPPDFVATIRQPGLRVFAHPTTSPIVVRWQPATSAFVRLQHDGFDKLLGTRQRGPTRDHGGQFVYAVETQPQDHHVAHAISAVQVGSNVVWCTASAPVAQNPPRAFFEACQSLMPASR